MKTREIAIQFGNSLDQDDYATTRKVLAEDCIYIIGKETITGSQAISNSYENNMIAGKKKLDELVWGQSRIEDISATEYYVHFTDYLKHKGKKYTHRCKQKVTVGNGQSITRIEHIHDPAEQESLDNYYRSVGLK